MSIYLQSPSIYKHYYYYSNRKLQWKKIIGENQLLELRLWLLFSYIDGECCVKGVNGLMNDYLGIVVK